MSHLPQRLKISSSLGYSSVGIVSVILIYKGMAVAKHLVVISKKNGFDDSFLFGAFLAISGLHQVYPTAIGFHIIQVVRYDVGLHLTKAGSIPENIELEVF